jgi:hypothetical protein
MSDHDAELDAIVAMMEEADLSEQHVNEPALHLTEKDAQLGRALARAGVDDPEAMLDA